MPSPHRRDDDTGRTITSTARPSPSPGSFSKSIVLPRIMPWILLSAHLDVIFSEFPKRVGLMGVAEVATKGVGMRFGRLFQNDYTVRSHGEAMSSLVWGAGVKLLTPTAFDVSRAALDLRRWTFS